jgi:hypothetical protein
MTVRLVTTSFCLFFCFLFAAQIHAQQMTVERVASGLSRPLFATHAPGDPNRLYVVQQGSGGTALIRILNLQTGTINSTPFMSVSGLPGGNEQGLLGLAFHPNYETNGLFYLNMTLTAGGGDTQIREYSRLNMNQGDPTSARTLMTINQPFTNHNGGWMGFGPLDGMLYIATGDGGSANDPQDNGQNVNSLLGKMLRIDPLGNNSSNGQYGNPSDNPFVGINGADEIWAYGLRNPWRSSFDRATGDFFIGDVGQNAREEINFQSATSTGGENYGWRDREGTLGGTVPGAIDPIYQYSHGSGDLQGRSVTGGYVYRGPIASLKGHYFFADYVNSRIWSFKFDGSNPEDFDGTNFFDFIDWTEVITSDVGTIGIISSFAEDAAGNLYIIDHGGEIFLITGATVPFVQGDMNGDGTFSNADIQAFVLALIDPAGYAAMYPYLNPDLIGDYDGNNVFTNSDIPGFVAALLGK